MHRKLFLFACFLTCVNDFLFAQKYPFVNYTPKDGLVNSRVRKAYQDSKGRIYFLTYGGLSVYDGARFRNYTTQNGLAFNMVNDILEVSDDSLLIAVNSTSVHTLVHGVLSNLIFKNSVCPLVNQLLKSEDGFVYASSDNGLFRIDEKGFEKLPLTLPGKNSNLLFLGSMIEYHNCLIFSTNDLTYNAGLYLYDEKAKKITDAFENSTINFIVKDLTNRIWISLQGKIVVLDSLALQKGKLKFDLPPPPFELVNSMHITHLSFDEQDTWASQDAKEIIRISNGSTRPPEKRELGVTGLHSIFIDKEHNIWVCNDGAGVFKLINTGLQINEKPFEKIAVVVGAFSDTTWFSTRDNQLYRKTKAGIASFSSNVVPAPLIIHQSTEKLLAADLNNIYEAVYPKKNAKQIFFRIKIFHSDSSILGRKIFIDPFGNCIAAITRGIMVLKNKQPIFKFILEQSDYVEGLQIDKSGRLWMATRYHGLTVFSLHPENPAQYLKPILSFPNLPGSLSPRAMLIDKKGFIWVGCRSHGLSVFALQDKTLKKLFQFQKNNGLTDDFVTSLACDSANNIIVGTQTGLDRIIPRKNDYYVENLTKSNNFFSYILQVWTSPDSNAYALTGNGSLVQVFAPPVKTENPAPAFFIEELKLNGQLSSLQKKLFSYDENNLSLSLAAPTFIDEKQVKFSYLLEGEGKNRWSDTSTNPEINLINLRAEKYRLVVKAFFPSTPYPPQELFYEFTVTPPWWQTWWFRLIVAAALTSVAVLFSRSYFQQKLQAQRNLFEKKRAVDKERTRIANDMHDDLGAGLSRIQFLSETIRRKKAGDPVIESDLNKISSYSREMIDKMGEIVWALNDKNDTLADLLAFTRSYAVDYLQNHQIDCQVQTPAELPQLYINGDTRRNIFLSVKECLFNIVKHANATFVTILFDIDTVLRISISDNGKGIVWEKVRPHSNGIANIRKRMRALEGSAEFIIHEGTSIRLSIPINRPVQEN